MSAWLSDYDYELPRELIAQHPLDRRENSRMMVLRRAQQTIEHRQFRELQTLLRPGDVLVLNDTRVLAARRFSDDGVIEFLFLEHLGTKRWKCLVNPGRKMRVGAKAQINGVTLRVTEITPDGERIITLDEDVDVYAGGSMPLPPYIKRPSDEKDATRYQTVFAHAAGAIAAPTAGLHFTSEILQEIPHTFVTLHVGPGTFLPVRSEHITTHRMHGERFSISPDAAGKINNARRIVAVGTTVVRVLETAAQLVVLGSAGASSTVSRVWQDTDRKVFGGGAESSSRTGGSGPCAHAAPPIKPHSGETDLFIYPTYQFRAVDALLTNFHLPRSTLLMLVSAFAGREFLLRAYKAAIRERYRFYSYGDCMLIM